MNSSRTANSCLSWKVGVRELQRGDLPLLMGILNVTPDSFSDGGQHDSVETAVAHGLQLVADGADIIDVGGESTRPGSTPVSVAEELSRTVPVIERLAQKTSTPISIDTTKAKVAAAAIGAGALIVNDISGMTFDAKMADLCAQHDIAVCAMHIKGTPQTMQHAPSYTNVVTEVAEFLNERMSALLSCGLAAERICLDPGIGFGKTF